MMSFSGKVKEELAGQTSSARHCQIAECAALLCFSAEYPLKKGTDILKAQHGKYRSCKKVLYIIGKNV